MAASKCAIFSYKALTADYPHGGITMDAMTYALTALAIACGILYWIALKQDLREQAKKKQQQRP